MLGSLGKFFLQNIEMSLAVMWCPPAVAWAAILPKSFLQLPQTNPQSGLPALLPSPAAPHFLAASPQPPETLVLMKDIPCIFEKPMLGSLGKFFLQNMLMSLAVMWWPPAVAWAAI